MGNYDYYLEHSKSEGQSSQSVSEEKKTKEKPVNDYFLQKQKQSEERKRQTKIKKAEEEIERLDAEIEQIQTQLASPEVSANYEKLMELTGELEKLQAQQEEQYLVWEELSSD